MSRLEIDVEVPENVGNAAVERGIFEFADAIVSTASEKTKEIIAETKRRTEVERDGAMEYEGVFEIVRSRVNLATTPFDELKE